MLGFFTIQLVAIKQCLAYSFTETSSLSWKNNSEKRPVEEGGSLLKSPLKTSSELNTEGLTPTPPAPGKALPVPQCTQGGKSYSSVLSLVREIRTFTAPSLRGTGRQLQLLLQAVLTHKVHGKSPSRWSGCAALSLHPGSSHWLHHWQHRYLEGWCSPRGSWST